MGLNTCFQVLVTSFGELEGNAFLEPRTAQVAIVDHAKQVTLISIYLSLSLRDQPTTNSIT